MTVTTEFGTWCNRVEPLSTSVEGTVEDAFGSEGSEGFDLDAIVSEYRTAINDALPDGVSLNGNTFYGPYHERDRDFNAFPEKDGALDIAAIVEMIDLWAIIEQHVIERD